jgi:hypothetical protein
VGADARLFRRYTRRARKQRQAPVSARQTDAAFRVAAQQKAVQAVLVETDAKRAR